MIAVRWSDSSNDPVSTDHECLEPYHPRQVRPRSRVYKTPLAPSLPAKRFGSDIIVTMGPLLLTHFSLGPGKTGHLVGYVHLLGLIGLVQHEADQLKCALLHDPGSYISSQFHSPPAGHRQTKGHSLLGITISRRK